MAAGHSMNSGRWRAEFDSLVDRVAGRFARVEVRRRVGPFLLGLTAGLGRTNCWTVSEHAVEASPHGMQWLLSRAVWDADAVRDDRRGYVVERLGDSGAVLVIDETDDLKKANGRSGSSGSTPAPAEGSKTPGSRSTWPTPPTGGTRSSGGHRPFSG
ncbi:DDE_5 domain-containing protein [Frankia sp. Hr75.2]|nr:DDE_5 domain-containing protein [Frankia sp. Hr75.2]